MITEDDVSVDRVFPMAPGSKTLAFVTVRVGPFLLKGFSVVRVTEDGEGITFVSMPRVEGKDGKYYNTIFIEDEDLLAKLNKKVMKAWYETVKAKNVQS